jgi:hypothetical protein
MVRVADISLAVVAMLAMTGASVGFAEPKITYVGLGRYSCHGTTAECAPYEQLNQMGADRRERAYQREQEQADAYVERNRREEEKRRYEQPR